jgi:hypothetical protein
MSDYWEPIHRYSRADTIRDGVLIVVTEMATQAGLKYPVALTRAAWDAYVVVPPGVVCQDEAGRLWDICWMLACAMLHGADGPELGFHLHVRNSNEEGIPPLVELKAVCGPGDRREPVITVLLPGED